MVSSKVEIEPGRALPEIPVARGDNVSSHAHFLAIGFQSLVGPDPDAFLLIGIDFTPSLIAPAACPVSLVLRALRHGTEEGAIKKGTITTIHTAKKGCLSHILKKVKDFFRPEPSVDPLSHGSEDSESPALFVKEEDMGQSGKPVDQRR